MGAIIRFLSSNNVPIIPDKPLKRDGEAGRRGEKRTVQERGDREKSGQGRKISLSPRLSF
jgi:hypothetical protein